MEQETCDSDVGFKRRKNDDGSKRILEGFSNVMLKAWSAIKKPNGTSVDSSAENSCVGSTLFSLESNLSYDTNHCQVSKLQNARAASEPAGDLQRRSSEDSECFSEGSDATRGTSGDSMLCTEGSWSPQSTVALNNNDYQSDVFMQSVVATLQFQLQSTATPSVLLSAQLCRANADLQQCELHEKHTFVPVHPSCPMLKIMDACQIKPVSVSLGSSYFQRLLERKPAMKQRVLEDGWFVHVVDEATGATSIQIRSVYRGSKSKGFFIIYATCIYIAAKFGDRIEYSNLLSTILSAVLQYRVTKETVRDSMMLVSSAGFICLCLKSSSLDFFLMSHRLVTWKQDASRSLLGGLVRCLTLNKRRPIDSNQNKGHIQILFLEVIISNELKNSHCACHSERFPIYSPDWRTRDKVYIMPILMPHHQGYNIMSLNLVQCTQKSLLSLIICSSPIR